MIYCMSDIHGEYDKFHEMLKIIEFTPQDTLYILGDVIDRCSGGVDLLKTIMAAPNMHMLLGNHEHMCLKTLGPQSEPGMRSLWKYNGGSCTYRELVYETSDIGRKQVLDFLQNLPLTIDLTVNERKFHLVHAWPSPREDDMLWGRPGDNLGKHWNDDVTPIIGHTCTYFLHPKDLGHPFYIHHDPSGYIAIDCGCGNETPLRRLACLRLDDMKEFYV